MKYKNTVINALCLGGIAVIVYMSFSWKDRYVGSFFIMDVPHAISWIEERGANNVKIKGITNCLVFEAEDMNGEKFDGNICPSIQMGNLGD